MRLSIAGRSVDLSSSRVVGIGLIVVGIALVAFAYGAHAEILKIGETNNPVLQHRISMLEDQRNVGVVSSVGFIFLGLFAIATLNEPTSPRTVSESEMIAAARMANGMTAGLTLTGNAAYLPARHGLTKERIFVPATMNGMRPPTALSDDLVLSPGKDGSSPGVVLEPLGLGLLDRIEKELETSVNNAGLEAAEGTLQMLKHGLNVVKDFHFKEREGKWLLRVEYGDLREACRTIRKEKPDTCRQMACIGCACLLTAAARATDKLVEVQNVDNETDSIVFTFGLLDW
jgi:hypothetical protein